MISGYFFYGAFAILFCMGFLIVLNKDNLISKVIGIAILQNSILIFYISLAFVNGSSAPILSEDVGMTYSNPLPYVLMLTAIVVGIATSAVALAIIVRIKDKFGSVYYSKIKEIA